MEKLPHRVTLRDIADKLHVTHVAISLALRDHPRISKDLRRRAQKLAGEMGYRPDPMLTALARHRLTKIDHSGRPTIAWLNVWPVPERLRQYKEFDSYWKGASSSAEKLGYQLNEFVLDADTTEKKLQAILEARNIHGILLPPTPQSIRELFANFDWNRFAIVRFGRSLDWPPSHVVTSDHIQNAILAFREVRLKGYKRIGFIGERSKSRLFSAGILAAHTEIEPSQIIPPLLLTDPTSPLIETSLCEWMRENRPDAIITEVPDIPRMLTSLGYDIPNDVGLAGLSLLDGKINAGIDQNSEAIGRVALLTLVSLINDFSLGNPPISRQILISGSWVDGPSMPKTIFSSE